MVSLLGFWYHCCFETYTVCEKGIRWALLTLGDVPCLASADIPSEVQLAGRNEESGWLSKTRATDSPTGLVGIVEGRRCYLSVTRRGIEDTDSACARVWIEQAAVGSGVLQYTVLRERRGKMDRRV